jgi:hypothetical protein
MSKFSANKKGDSPATMETKVDAGVIIKVGGVRWTYVSEKVKPLFVCEDKISRLSFVPRYVGTQEVCFGEDVTSFDIRIYTPASDHSCFWFSGCDIAKALKSNMQQKTLFKGLEDLSEKGKTRLTGVIVNLAGLKKLADSAEKGTWDAWRSGQLYTVCAQVVRELSHEVASLAAASSKWQSEDSEMEIEND